LSRRVISRLKRLVRIGIESGHPADSLLRAPRGAWAVCCSSHEPHTRLTHGARSKISFTFLAARRIQYPMTFPWFGMFPEFPPNREKQLSVAAFSRMLHVL